MSVRTTHSVTRISGVLAIALGLAVLAGWVHEVAWLKSPVAGAVAMKPHTALGFILGGLGLALIGRPGRWQRVARLATWLMLMLGLLTLVQYVFAADLRIEGLLLAPLWAIAGVVPERMSPAAALSFVLIGASTLLFRQNVRYAVSSATALASLVAVLAFIELAGYSFDAPLFYLGGLEVEPVSVHSAIGFLLLAGGCLFLNPASNVPTLVTGGSVAGAHFRALLPTTVAVPLAVAGVALVGLDTVYSAQTAIALTAVGSALAIAALVIVNHVVLKRAEDFLYLKDRALESVQIGVLITDHQMPDDPLVYVNPAFTAITGYTPDEVIGRNCRLLNVGMDNPSASLELVRTSIRDGQACELELLNRRKHGSAFWNHLLLAPVSNQDGDLTHYLGIIEDVTPDIERERNLTDALDSLRATSKAMEAFVRVVSHELRGPLNAASTWVSLMEIDRTQENLDQGLRTVRRTIEDQARIINDLVDASHAVMPAIELQIASVDLGEILGSLVTEWRTRVSAKNQSIIFEHDGAIGLVAGDATRLRQIFGNLLSNAHKYASSGGSISIRVDIATDREFVITRVSDDGVGLSAEQLDRVFDPDWRADHSIPGLGLGLGIVKHLVDGHRGSVLVTSDGLRQGTTVTVALPRPGSRVLQRPRSR